MISQSENSPPFVEPDCSLPYFQHPTSKHYPKPDILCDVTLRRWESSAIRSKESYCFHIRGSWAAWSYRYRCYGPLERQELFTKRHSSTSQSHTADRTQLHTSTLRLKSILVVSSHLRLHIPSGLFPSGVATKVFRCCRQFTQAEIIGKFLSIWHK